MRHAMIILLVLPALVLLPPAAGHVSAAAIVANPAEEAFNSVYSADVQLGKVSASGEFFRSVQPLPPLPQGPDGRYPEIRVASPPFPRLGATAAPASAKQDPMSTRVYLPKIESGDVLQILYRLTPQDARVSFEAFRLYNDASRLILKDFVISEGRYTIKDILDRIHAATGAVTWTVGPDSVRIKVKISGEFPDPLDTKVPNALAGKFTAPEVVAWLNKQIPDLKMHAEDVILGGRSPWVPFDLSIQPGTSVRGVLDTLACKMNMGWGAEVYSAVQELQATIKGESPPKPHVVYGPRISVRFGEFGWRAGPKSTS